MTSSDGDCNNRNSSYGALAQLVEHLTCTENVAGSTPVRSTIYLASYCPGFDSPSLHHF